MFLIFSCYHFCFINPNLVFFHFLKIIVKCFDSYNIQCPMWGKGDSSFWKKFSELLPVRWMVTTVLEIKLMNFPQINLNQMQKVRCFSAGWVARTISDKQQQSCPSRYWREAGNVLSFSARESYATVSSILKTINLEELCTYFKREASKRLQLFSLTLPRMFCNI